MIYKLKPQASAGQNVRTAAHTDHKLWTCTSNGLAQYDAIADVFRKAHIPGTMSTEDMIQIDSSRFLAATRNASYIYIIRLQIRLKSSDWTRTVLSFSTHPAKTETMRMKRACELMKETTLSVADIAEQTGFQTPGYFIKVFKNHFGETPGHYASRVRQQ